MAAHLSAGHRSVNGDVPQLMIPIPEDESVSENTRLVSPLHDSLASAVRVHLSGVDPYGRRVFRRGQIRLCDKHMLCCILLGVLAAAIVFCVWYFLLRKHPSAPTPPPH